MGEKNKSCKNDQRKQESQSSKNSKPGQEHQTSKNENGCRSEQYTGR